MPHCESPRWGYIDTATNSAPFTKSDAGYLSDKPYGDWDRNTYYIVNQWIPQTWSYYLNRMQAIGLFQP